MDGRLMELKASEVFWKLYLELRDVEAGSLRLKEHETMAPDVARRNMSELLLAQVQYFGTRGDAIPEWREAAKIRDPKDLWKIWHQLPIITRRDLQSRFRAAETKARFRVAGVVSATGGSTGEPTPYLHDSSMLRASVVTRAYCRSRLGWRPGMPTIAVWGAERDIGRANSWRNRVSGRLRNDWLVDGYSLSSRTLDRFHEILRRRHPAAVYGFTSMLQFIASETLRQGTIVPKGWVAAAWNGGEMLYPEQADLFQRAFSVPILNLYGSRELSAMAYQPAFSQPMTVLRPYLFVEVLDERNEPASSGQCGRLVWTSTVCRGTPFLRYECGDLGCYADNGVDESGVRKLQDLQGRTAGIITLPDGRKVNNLFWNHLFKNFPEVEQFQVALRGGAALELRFRGAGFSDQRRARVENIVGKFVGGMPISINWVERIPVTRQGGKLEQVVIEP